MPAYEVEIEHRENDQVFSYWHGSKLLHFNTSLLARLREQMPKEFRRVTMTIGAPEYDLCMKQRGVEEEKVEKLTPPQLRDPGYAVMFEEGTFSIVDGHHRLVRRYRGGVRVMDFFVTQEAVWTHCLVEYTEEGESKIAEALPPRTDESEQIASHITVHGDDDGR